MTALAAAWWNAPDEMEKPDNRSDAELLRLSLARDETAFRILYERLKLSIYRYAFFMTGSRTAAEEVTQETFMTLLGEGAKYDTSKGEVISFALGIARNLTRRIGRRESAYEPLPDEESQAALGLISSADSLPANLVREQNLESLRRAVASLPERYRQMVVLCDLCELTYAEAASELGCAVGTVRSRLSRAHDLLAKKMKLPRDLKAELRTGGAERCLS